jgi:hypothetical protein
MTSSRVSLPVVARRRALLHRRSVIPTKFCFEIKLLSQHNNDRKIAPHRQLSDDVYSVLSQMNTWCVCSDETPFSELAAYELYTTGRREDRLDSAWVPILPMTILRTNSYFIGEVSQSKDSFI